MHSTEGGPVLPPPPDPPPLRLPPPPGADAGAEGPTDYGARGPRRLHPAVMVVWPLAQVGTLVVLVVLGVLQPIILIGLIGASAIAGAVRYLRFRWQIADGSLVIEQGLIQRQRRVIPLERIQTVDLVRPVRHRLLGVVEVRVEAVGGGSTEGKLDALGVDEAQRLRAALLGARSPSGAADGASADADGSAGEDQLVAMRPGRLVVAGLTGGRVGVAAALLGFASQVFGDRADDLLVRAPALLGGVEGFVAAAVLVLAAAFLLSIVATVVSYWDFRLWRDDDELRIRRGLLEQRLDTIPLRRVQSVRVEENLVRRLLGLAVVKVDVAGRAGSDTDRNTGILLPLGRRADAFALVHTLTGQDLAAVTLDRMPTRARSRRLVRAVAATVVLALPPAVLLWPLGLTGALVGVPLVLAALDAYRALGWRRLPEGLVARSGVLVRTTAFVADDRLQSLSLSSSPPQRWRQLRTLDLQIARSPGVWGGPQVLDLDAEVGRRLLGELAEASARSAPSRGL